MIYAVGGQNIDRTFAGQGGGQNLGHNNKVYIFLGAEQLLLVKFLKVISK